MRRERIIMTGNELIEQIKALGFEGDADSTDRLYSVITLSMRLIAAEYPKILSKEIVKQRGEVLTVSPSELYNCKMLARNPIFKEGVPYSSAFILDGTATLPKEAEGVFTVRYVESLPAFCDSLCESELCLDPCAQHLLPLLVSALFWQDDEPEKARLYMHRYEEGARLLRSQRIMNNPSVYNCENGW